MFYYLYFYYARHSDVRPQTEQMFGSSKSRSSSPVPQKSQINVYKVHPPSPA